MANRYLRDRFIPDFNAEFGCPPRERRSAFVRIGAVDLEQILCVWNTSASSVATTSSPLTRLLIRKPLSFLGPHPKHVPFGA